MELPFLPDRDYFTMAEAVRMASVPAHTLRYWETRFGDLRRIVLPRTHQHRPLVAALRERIG